jgi:uncharacterized protein (DUF1684 family)
MLKALGSACAVAGFCFAFSLPTSAQEVIHALTGTVSAINSAQKTITVYEDNGSRGVFQDMANPKTRVAFDKRIAAESTSAAVFDKSGAYVIVFYYGDADNPTAVALKSLGAGPFTSTMGTVTHYDGHGHTLTVQDKSGAAQSFRISDSTIGEGSAGVVGGLKLSLEQGDRVRVVSTVVDGSPTALFVGN